MFVAWIVTVPLRSCGSWLKKSTNTGQSHWHCLEDKVLKSGHLFNNYTSCLYEVNATAFYTLQSFAVLFESSMLCDVQLPFNKRRKGNQLKGFKKKGFKKLPTSGKTGWYFTLQTLGGNHFGSKSLTSSTVFDKTWVLDHFQIKLHLY